jgi:hypothetical protein
VPQRPQHPEDDGAPHRPVTPREARVGEGAPAELLTDSGEAAEAPLCNASCGNAALAAALMRRNSVVRVRISDDNRSPT